MNNNKPKPSIFSILRKHYPANEYALMQEVRDAAGFGASRSADFVAVNLWPSRGLAVNGIELKSYRNDWLNELKNPEKAEKIFQFCDYFWLLTADDGIAKIDEIPATWGWMTVKSGKITTLKEAPKLQPVSISRNFLCTMLKRATDKTDFVHVDDIVDRIESARESAKNSNTWELKHTTEENDRLRKILDDFRKETDIDLANSTWDRSFMKDVAKSMRFVRSGGIDTIKSELLGLEKTASKILSGITHELSEVKEKETIEP